MKETSEIDFTGFFLYTNYFLKISCILSENKKPFLLFGKSKKGSVLNFKLLLFHHFDNNVIS